MDLQKEYFNAKEVAAILGMESRTFLRRMKEGIYPRPSVRRGRNSIFWSAEDVKGMSWYERNKGRYRASKTELPKK